MFCLNLEPVPPTPQRPGRHCEPGADAAEERWERDHCICI